MFAHGWNYVAMSDRPGTHDTTGLQALLRFFSSRVLRGGPRILMQLATCLVGLPPDEAHATRAVGRCLRVGLFELFL